MLFPECVIDGMPLGCAGPSREGPLSALPNIALEHVLSYLDDQESMPPNIRLTCKWLCLSFDGCNSHLDSLDNATDSESEARLRRRSSQAAASSA
jgi:hypothetical protein